MISNSAKDSNVIFGAWTPPAPSSLPPSLRCMPGRWPYDEAIAAEEHELRRRMVLALGLEILPSGTTSVIRDRRGREWRICQISDSNAHGGQEGVMGHRPPQDPAERGREARASLTSQDVFYRRYYPPLVRFLKSQADDMNWAEDVAQEAMIAAYDKWDDLLNYDRPDSWLFKVAIRKLRRLEARARERCWLDEDLSSSEGDLRMAAVTDDWVDDHLDLIGSLRSLPRRQREVVALHCLVGCTLAETANILGMNEATAKTHKHRGLDRLRQLVHQPQPAPVQ